MFNIRLRGVQSLPLQGLGGWGQSWPLQGLSGGQVEQQSLHLKGVDKWHLVLLESKWWFPTIRGPFWGVPIIGAIIFGSLYWGLSILGNH